VFETFKKEGSEMVNNSAWRQMMKQLFAVVCALALLSLISPPETRAVEMRHAGPFSYDVSKEVTLHGTVSDVLKKPAKGMIMGSHLLIKTGVGELDASLGRFGLQGRGALSVEAGKQVEVTGVMKTLKGKQVFITRTVTVDGHAYTMRNEHGISQSPQARERAGEKTADQGVYL
jgi:DNA/RNA endonuclease YhcR with UshA esterase domain